MKLYEIIFFGSIISNLCSNWGTQLLLINTEVASCGKPGPKSLRFICDCPIMSCYKKLCAIYARLVFKPMWRWQNCYPDLTKTQSVFHYYGNLGQSRNQKMFGDASHISWIHFIFYTQIWNKICSMKTVAFLTASSLIPERFLT